MEGIDPPPAAQGQAGFRLRSGSFSGAYCASPLRLRAPLLPWWIHFAFGGLAWRRGAGPPPFFEPFWKGRLEAFEEG